MQLTRRQLIQATAGLPALSALTLRAANDSDFDPKKHD